MVIDEKRSIEDIFIVRLLNLEFTVYVGVYKLAGFKRFSVWIGDILKQVEEAHFELRVKAQDQIGIVYELGKLGE